MALTVDEEKELQALELEFSDKPTSSNLTDAEESELSQLESEFGGSPEPEVPQSIINAQIQFGDVADEPQQSDALFAPNESDSLLKAGAKDFAGNIVGIPEVATTLASGAISAPISYTGEVLTTALAGGERGEEVGQAISNALTYKPKTQYARDVLSTVSKVATPFTWPGKAGSYIGKKIDESLGNTKREWEVGLKNVANAPLQAIGLRVGLQQAGLLKKYPNINKIKSIDADIDQRISKVVKDKFYHSVRPTGKKKFSELKEFHNKTGRSERWLAENKKDLVFEDPFTGEVTKGHLPKTAIQNAQAYEQGFEILMKRANDITIAETGHGLMVNMQPFIKKLNVIARENAIASPNVTNQALQLIKRLKKSPVMSMDDVLRDLKQINARQGGKISPTYTEYGSMQVDNAHAGFLRKSLYDHAEGTQELRSLAADFKTAEPFVAKAAARRLNIDPEKMDFLDIGAITAVTHAIATPGAGTFAQLVTGGSIALLNRLRKHAKDVDIQTNRMYKKIDKIVEPSREMGRVFSRGGVGLPKQDPLSKTAIEHTPRAGFERSGVVKETSNVPPITTRGPNPQKVITDVGEQVTRGVRKGKSVNVKGRKPLEIIEMNMDDISGQKGSFTVKDSRGRILNIPVKDIRAEFNNPIFWKKNPDLTKSIIEANNGLEVSPDTWNGLLIRVMQNLKPKKSWYERKSPPLKGGANVGRNTVVNKAGEVFTQNPRTGIWEKR